MTGILTGMVNGQQMYFTYEEDQSYDLFTAYRYVKTSEIDSCFLLFDGDSSGVAYFRVLKGKTYVTISDYALYDMPKQ